MNACSSLFLFLYLVNRKTKHKASIRNINRNKRNNLNGLKSAGKDSCGFDFIHSILDKIV
jgi:hypothetical protein